MRILFHLVVDNLRLSSYLGAHRPRLRVIEFVDSYLFASVIVNFGRHRRSLRRFTVNGLDAEKVPVID